MKEAKIKFQVINTPKGLVPASDGDVAIKKQLKYGKVYTIELVETRSSLKVIQFQTMLDIAFENQSKYVSKEQMLNGLMFNAGLYETKKDTNGVEYPERLSTSFESMDEIEFDMIFKAVALQICMEFNFDAEGLREQIKFESTNVKNK